MLGSFILNSAPRRVLHASLILTMVPLGAHAAPGDTTVVSWVDGSTVQARGGGCGPGGKPHECVSADGRYVVFSSEAPDLVAGDTNGVADIFVRDRVLQVTTRVNKGPGGEQANRPASSPAISADGRFVAYDSAASNLVANDTNGADDVFVYDRATGATERVNLTEKGEQAFGYIPGDLASISGDGRYVAFCSRSRLVASDTNDDTDVYVRDRVARTTQRVSVGLGGTAGDGFIPSISASGRFVSFSSGAPNIAPGDTNGISDVFVRDLQTGVTERVSIGSDGTEGWGYQSAISADGRHVAFRTTAAFDPADTNGKYDIYVRDRLLGLTTRASVATNGGRAWGNSFDPAISADGRYVAFTSEAPNLVPGDTNGTQDVFVRDLESGTTERASIASSGAEGNEPSGSASMSAQGDLVVFQSGATNLVEGVSGALYLHELGGPKVTAWTLQPSVLPFGVRTVTTSGSADALIQNTGTVPLWVSSAVISGTDSSQFGVANSCRSWVQPEAGCAIGVLFVPTSIGDKAAVLGVTAGATVQSVSLTGTGVRASFSATPGSLAFGDVTVGTASTALSVTLSNTGAGVLPIKSVSLNGLDRSQFRRWSNCPASLPVSDSCIVRVRFVPTSAGAKAAELTVRGGGWAGTKSVALAGEGLP